MILLRSNHHRGRYASPALATASYPFVDLPPGITLHYKLLLSDKISKIRLCFFYGIVYNEASDKSEFTEMNSINETIILKFKEMEKCQHTELQQNQIY